MILRGRNFQLNYESVKQKMQERLKLFGVSMLIVGLFFVGLYMAASPDPEFNWPIKLLGVGAWVYILSKFVRDKNDPDEGTSVQGSRLIESYNRYNPYLILAMFVWAILLLSGLLSLSL